MGGGGGAHKKLTLWQKKTKKVSKLVFYAQSTGAVISGWEKKKKTQKYIKMKTLNSKKEKQMYL